MEEWCQGHQPWAELLWQLGEDRLSDAVRGPWLGSLGLQNSVIWGRRPSLFFYFLGNMS